MTLHPAYMHPNHFTTPTPSSLTATCGKSKFQLFAPVIYIKKTTEIWKIMRKKDRLITRDFDKTRLPENWQNYVYRIYRNKVESMERKAVKEHFQ